MLHLLQLNEPLIQMDEVWPVHIVSRKCSLNELLLSLEIYHIPQVCCSCLVTSAMSDSVQPHGLQPVRLPCPWDSLGKSSGVGFHALFQGIFLTHGLNLGLLHCRQILYHWATRDAHPSGILGKKKWLRCTSYYEPYCPTRGFPGGASGKEPT